MEGSKYSQHNQTDNINIGNLEWLGEGLGSRITANLRDVCGTAEEHTSL